VIDHRTTPCYANLLFTCLWLLDKYKLCDNSTQISTRAAKSAWECNELIGRAGFRLRFQFRKGALFVNRIRGSENALDQGLKRECFQCVLGAGGWGEGGFGATLGCTKCSV
jgi:hypothetical protein